jgi:glycosyltransferase involved in cell wall biosynthesis
MPEPRISVAMSVYNSEQYLALAIESVLAQTFADFEFLILNDGSVDGSRAIIDHYAERDLRIRAIHRENKGLVISLNELLAEARAPLIARMDGDDICLPERFEKQVAFMDANPDHGVVGTWTADIDEDGNPYLMRGADHPTTYEDFLDVIGKRSLLCHPSAMMRRDIVLSVGGYHAAFKHCEDFDLWLRLASVTKLSSIPERLLKYRHWSNQVSTKYAYVQQIGAAISYQAYLERIAGRPDRTEHLNELPPIDQLDILFGKPGMTDAAKAYVVPNMLYSIEALRGAGHDLLLDYIESGGSRDGLWRTVARLVRYGEPARAAALAFALMR